MRDRVLNQIREVQPELYNELLNEFGLPEKGKEFINFIKEADKRTE